MKINKLFLYSLLALLTSCSQEELMVVERPTAGEEVQFGMSLDKNSITRTIYGEESDNKFPIYWENGDEVQVVSPQCMLGRNMAGYKVTVNNETSNTAQSLTKIGDTGIQWGNTEEANFYSVYPLENVSRTAISGSDATFTITMPAEQNILLEDVHDKPTMKRPEMEACFMYAGVVGPNVEGTKNVNLTYKPLSTAIRFTLTGPTEMHTNSGDVIVSKIVLTAPTGTAITGEFTTKVSVSKDENGTETLTATVTPVAGNTSNEATIYSHYDDGTNRGYLTLKKGETIDMCAFVMLKENTDFSEWKMTIHLASGATFTKTLKLTGDVTNPNTLVARKVNKVPQLPEMYNSTSDWNPANWMVNIPRNVYLSEISIPGSWNSLNKEFSPNNDITAQYKYGIRAFHLDTRWKRTGNWLFGGYDYVLGIADGGGTSSGSSNKYMTDSDNTEFSTALKNITDNVKQDEYMLVFVTFAQNSADYDRDNGGWQKAVSDACNNINSVISADNIKANTVVGDVLGKVIVIINNTEVMSNYTPPTDSKCFFSYIPMELSSDMFTNVTTNNKVYNANAMHYASGDESGIVLYNHHAQVTSTNAENGAASTSRGYMPSIKERQAMVTNIWNWADANYAKEDYAHNAWIYLGMGGYFSNTSGASTGTAHKGVADAMNPFVNSRINNMSSRPTGEQTAYHPVGIVFMNYTDTHQPTVKNILQLNTKYRQAYNPDWTPDNADKAKSDVKSVATGYSSGMVDNNTNAMGWD